MKLHYTMFLLFISSLVSAQGMKPEIRGMWTSNNVKKPKVYTISNEEIICNVSDINNRYASSVKNFKTVDISETDIKNGRIIAKLDSENVSKYVTIYYFNLNTDSVRVAEVNQRFDELEAAKACTPAMATQGEFFYTNEYMGRLARIRKTPALTKEGYKTFLREVIKELQKPQNKGRKPEAGKLPDVQAKEFMISMLSQKQYQGKIIPETLEVAMEAFKEDASVKKTWPTIRMNFIPKPGPAPAK